LSGVMFVVSSIDVEDEKDKMWLMGCVVKEEWCGWMLRNSSGTYRVVVIRPQLSRTATASKGYTSNRSCISVFDRPIRVTLAL
jgi:hypothetical protein